MLDGSDFVDGLFADLLVLEDALLEEGGPRFIGDEPLLELVDSAVSIT